ncbi:MAG: anti-sigma factor antagonist [Magnetospirillum sp.]|nr:MAG: anti-sigma factor antagonist [Magnetospirillum sp.]
MNRAIDALGHGRQFGITAAQGGGESDGKVVLVGASGRDRQPDAPGPEMMKKAMPGGGPTDLVHLAAADERGPQTRLDGVDTETAGQNHLRRFGHDHPPAGMSDMLDLLRRQIIGYGLNLRWGHHWLAPHRFWIKVVTYGMGNGSAALKIKGSGMDYAFDVGSGSLAVLLDGRMTHGDYKGFRSILARINEDKPQRVLFDLTKVSFIDSSALGMLLIIRDAAVQDKRDVVLKGASGQVQTLINVGKLDKYFIIE